MVHFMRAENGSSRRDRVPRSSPPAATTDLSISWKAGRDKKPGPSAFPSGSPPHRPDGAGGRLGHPKDRRDSAGKAGPGAHRSACASGRQEVQPEPSEGRDHHLKAVADMVPKMPPSNPWGGSGAKPKHPGQPLRDPAQDASRARTEPFRCWPPGLPDHPPAAGR